MEWLYSLFFGSGIAHSVLVLALVITAGTALSKLKIKGISLGATWILFVGIAASHFGMNLDAEVLQFVKEFGLILFVFSIGLQVGPSFFASVKQGGVKVISLATLVVILGVVTTYVIHLISGTPLSTMVGVLSGAVTNTPGLGAAQQAFTDSTGIEEPNIAMAYAVTYPLGVVGVIIAIIALRYAMRIDFKREDEGLKALSNENKFATKLSIEVTNEMMNGQSVGHVKDLINRQFVVSRIAHKDNSISIADASTTLTIGDRLLVVCAAEDVEAIVTFLGHEIQMEEKEWKAFDSQLVSRRIVITRNEINGKRFADLRLRTKYGINITRVNRAGVDLIPYQGMELQVGDRVMVVGSEKAVEQVASLLGNSLKKLNHPHIITIFLGIALGVILGSIPIVSIPQPVKLGLAGGPLIVALLIARFGTHMHLITYTTMSANLMLREIGISLFLACVGLGAGDGFVDTVINGGYVWIGYGAIITILPILLVGIFARFALKMNFYTIMGTLSGSMTDPIALAFSNTTAGNDMPAVSYATVYPVTMFLRVLTAQLLIMFAL
ncbi:MAG: putative transporter [Rikenellaceae bacterium]|nr:putative transporter [Rikenellaceae bacterium]